MSGTINIPELGEGLEEATLAAITVSVGDSIDEGDEVAELETDKASMDIPSPKAGVIEEIKFDEGDTVTPGDTLFVLKDQEENRNNEESNENVDSVENVDSEENEDSEESKDSEESDNTEQNKDTEESKESEKSKESLANKESEKSRDIKKDDEDDEDDKEDDKEDDEDDKEDKGSSHNKQDEKKMTEVEELVGEKVKDRIKEVSSAGSKSPITKHELGGWQRKAAEIVQKSWDTIPHVTLHRCANVDKLNEFLTHNKETIDLNSTLIKLTSEAIKKYPSINGIFDDQCIEVNEAHNFSIAVDRKEQLAMLTLKDVQDLSIQDIQARVSELVKKVEKGSVEASDTSEGTFGISNLGAKGVEYFSPIIYPPQLAILGIGAMTDEKISFSLSFNHSALTGNQAAEFLDILVKIIEQPASSLV